MIQRGQYGKAKYLLVDLTKNTTDAESLLEARHLSAVCCQKQGQFETAVEQLQQLVQRVPDSVRFLNAYANALQASGDAEQALNYYQMAVDCGIQTAQWQQRPEYRDAWLNWLVALVKCGNRVNIARAFTRYREQSWQDYRIDRQYAAYLQQSGDLVTAENILRRLIEERPNYVAAHHDLAVCLRLRGNAQEAIQRYAWCAQSGLDTADFWLNFGNALTDEFKITESVQAYSRALVHQPFFLQVHENLCDLLYEGGHHGQVFEAYEQALSMPSAPFELWLSCIDKALRMSAGERARVYLERCLAGNVIDGQPSNRSRYLLRVVQYISMYGQPVMTYQPQDLPNCLQQIDHHDLNHDESQRYVECCLALGVDEQALRVTQHCLTKRPDDQAWLALASVQPTYTQLTGCLHQLVYEYRIQPPTGFSSLTAYLAELAELLRRLHRSTHQPLEQTVHKGTQTRGNLFDNPHPLIQHIATQYRSAVLAFLQHFDPLREQYEPYPGFWPPSDVGAADIEFTGSWSVLLSSGGYHSNHFHPMGWLSSALYIELPSRVHGHQGAFQFGQPNFQIAHENKGGYVTPEPGKLLLFPSCLWHGTMPFTESQKRLSIACDLVVKNRW